MFESSRGGSFMPEISAERKKPDPPIRLGKFLDDFKRSVATAVINEPELRRYSEIGNDFFEATVERPKTLCLVKNRHDNRKLGMVVLQRIWALAEANSQCATWHARDP